MNLGHKLRDGAFAAMTSKPDERVTTGALIVGGGISGLSAAWWLGRNGYSDFILAELEPNVGGNSTGGKNDISAFPWGAHYVPLANRESELVHMLFEELEIITGKTKEGEPIYNELFLCHDPQERLLKDGIFQEGLVPNRGLQPEDKAQMSKFFATIDSFRHAQGADGKPAFAIPLALSSTDKRYRSLDSISMKQWMDEHEFTSRPLRWYVNYCCRDDYGSSINDVSAWAGIHYFAGRRGTCANAEPNSVVTWPQGNGFLVEQLRSRCQDKIRSNMPVVNISTLADKQVVSRAIDSRSNRMIEFVSDSVIVACPRFVASRIINLEHGESTLQPTYSPWLVANLSMARLPGGRGAGLAWDNVSYNSPSLGYVVATHQNVSTRQARSVLTYYLPLSDMEPTVARRELYLQPPEKWAARIIDDLEQMHPGILQEILAIDLYPWGHGMVRPSVGYIWGGEREKLSHPYDSRILFAHSDMSGISNFEEAQYQGVQAARQALALAGSAGS